jgi:Spy/CpxP family protein refolding chaperone
MAEQRTLSADNTRNETHRNTERTDIMKRRYTPWTVALVITLIAGTALAQGGWTGQETGHRQGPGRPGGQGGPRRQGGPGGGGMHHGGIGRLLRNPRVAEELGLTEEQTAALKEGGLDFQRQRIDINASLQKAELELRELMEGNSTDEAALMSAIEKVGDIRTELHKLSAKQMLLVKSTLTDEQREQIRELTRRRMAGRQQGRHGAGQPARGHGPRGRGPQRGGPPPEAEPEGETE